MKAKADQIRQEVVRVALENRAGHIAPSLSCVEILVSLFYNVLTDDDSFILSKAHGGYAYYAILADKGLLPRDRWEKFDLPGCVERMPEYGIIAGCGALGHGLPMAAGLAYANKLQKKPGTVFCLIGDGEMQEGSNWEAIQFITAHSLRVLILIDDNQLQAMEFTSRVLPQKYSLKARLRAFGLTVSEANGHDVDSVAYFMRKSLLGAVLRPGAIIFRTVKGFGLPCAENTPKFHYRIPGCLTEN